MKTILFTILSLLLPALTSAAVVEPRWANETYLSSAGLSANNVALFNYGMDILDSNFGLPFLWQSPKLSSWYAVGLLARNQGGDVQVANKLLANIVTQQYTDETFIGYGTFKDPYYVPYSDGNSLFEPKIYDSFDPNINLFFTIAAMIIDSQFSDLIEASVLENMRKAMYIAVVGDGYRVGGIDDDNLYPGYSNPWYMRVVSAAYVGSLFNDANITYWGEVWAKQAIDLFDEHNSISEFNGGTYAGVTLFAISLAQYTPKNSTIYNAAPRLISTIWDQIAETYNPSLNTLSGPWDRTYGFDLTQYYGILGSAITGLIGLDGSYPMPKPLDGSVHYTDIAIIPMQMVVAPYMEAQITSQAKSKLSALYGDHYYTAQTISPPWDKRPRNYTYWVADGLSAGGVSFDEGVVGGPSINQPSFSPGVILWDAGKGGAGSGYISYYPSNPSCEIVASSTNLTIRYVPTVDWPNSTVSNAIQLSISSLPNFQLNKGAFANGQASLPGLDVSLSGNVVDQGTFSLTFTGDAINSFEYYNLTYSFPSSLSQGNYVPELVVGFTKTTPPSYDLFV
ncbi:hypothetical protein CI109_100714 [Kwoniella shandongensis]|uniref:Uncharacterized protein n=1 Tax=Kwoniella shandongensis TaxID=1734106 RepID=A0A5M6BZ05_9TREE|nr:uncharacterized protein CI109_003365 [Kwoniella shandongensis]KAA5528077.1 hypothetical protein CI109_003365 [Kwoniella shandongensis]